MAAASIPLNNVLRQSDVVLAAGVMSMLLIMVVPLPILILDLLLALSITVGVLILFVALFTKSSLEFSSFPSVLLIATIFRLSVNVASTRLILIVVRSKYFLYGANNVTPGSRAGAFLVLSVLPLLLRVALPVLFDNKTPERVESGTR